MFHPIRFRHVCISHCSRVTATWACGSLFHFLSFYFPHRIPIYREQAGSIRWILLFRDGCCFFLSCCLPSMSGFIGIDRSCMLFWNCSSILLPRIFLRVQSLPPSCFLGLISRLFFRYFFLGSWVHSSASESSKRCTGTSCFSLFLSSYARTPIVAGQFSTPYRPSSASTTLHDPPRRQALMSSFDGGRRDHAASFVARSCRRPRMYGASVAWPAT